MRKFWFGALAVVLVAAGCGNDNDDSAAGDDSTAVQQGGERTVTVYSGRSKELIEPLLADVERELGIKLRVRYGDTAEMAAAILEEGSNSPADIFFGQDAGALGALSSAGRLQKLEASILDRVPAQYRSVDDDWVGVSGRARTVIYNTQRIGDDELPDSILGFTDRKWRNRLGWAPTNGSFQAFATALRVLEGEDGAEQWLRGIRANNPRVFERNSAIVEAVAAGEIDAGFVNHYYLFQLRAKGSNMEHAANRYYTDGDPGALINIAGVGIVDSAAHVDAAREVVDFLLSSQAQAYFASETFEIPMIEGVTADEELPDLESLTQPDVDLNQLRDLDGTIELLRKVGAI